MTGPTRDTPTLQARQLAFAYPGGRCVFEGVSLTVQPREIVALLGGSGCGKSTLLRVLARLVLPTRGELRFLGEPLAEPHPRAALLFQQPSLLPWLSVAGNVGFGLDFRHQPALSEPARAERVRAAIAAVGLAGRETLRPSQLSGGMTQRVALALALAREPQLLLADEPFSALDAITRAQMQTLLVDVVRRWHTAALLVTHDIDEALLVADRVLLLGEREPGAPAGVLREWAIGLERPRERRPEALAALRFEILATLQTQQLAA